MPAWQAQYGPWPCSFFAPQKRNSDWAGSPIGQWHIDSRNSTMVTGSDISTTTSLTVWGAAASITNWGKPGRYCRRLADYLHAGGLGATTLCGAAVKQAHCPGARWRGPIARAGRPFRSLRYG